MKKEISAILDKVLTKGMEIMESEKAQKLLSSPQAQKAMDLGLNALTMAQNASDAVKANIASKLGLATQKEVDELRETIAKLEAEKAACATAEAEKTTSDADKAE